MKSTLLVVSFVVAIAGCGSERPAETGFFLGYHGGSGGYHTLWISVSPQQARVVADLPDLIVRRRDGFWRAGTAAVCDTAGTREEIWFTRVGSVPHVAGPLCPDAPNPTEPDTVPERGSDTTETAEQHQGCDAYEAVILFVSPRYLADQHTTRQTEECEPRGGRWQDENRVHPFAPDRPLSLANLFPQAAAAHAYDSAVAVGFLEMKQDGWNCPEPSLDDQDLKSWAVQHLRGAWRPVARYNVFGGECEFLHEIALDLPDTVTGDKAPANDSWQAFSRQVPKLTDFFVSPDADCLVAITGAPGSWHLEIYALSSGRIGTRLLEQELPGMPTEVISTAWVKGDSLAEWSRLLEGIRGKPLPRPKSDGAEGPN